MTSASQENETSWTLVIRPQRGLFDLRLDELWKSRELIGLFVWRDFVSVYKQTILGPLWYLIQPILTTTTFTVFFGKIANLSTDGLPDFLFYLSGTTVWSYFSECMVKTSDTFARNSALFGKVYFPRLTVPISILVSGLISFAIQFFLFLVFEVYFWLSGSNISPNGWVLLLPVLLLLMAGLGFGLGIIISSLTTRYRDLRFLVSFGAQLLMYATPVIYPLSSIPERFRLLLLANPISSIIEAFRYAFLGSGELNFYGLAYSFVFMVFISVIGIMVFNRVENTFMDTV